MAYNMISSNLIHAIETAYQNQKFVDADVLEHPEWVRDAIAWAEAQVIAGTALPFVQSLMQQYRRNPHRSMGQYRGLLNCIRAEVNSADRNAQQIIDQVTSGKEPFDLSKLPSGHYAVMKSDGNPSFYVINNIKEEGSKW